MGECDRLERAVGEILDPNPPERVVVEEAGRGRRVVLEPRLGGRGIGERVRATAEARVDQDPAPAGNVEARVGAVLQGGPRRGVVLLDPLSPESELRLRVDRLPP